MTVLVRNILSFLPNGWLSPFKFPASCRWSQCIDWISQMHKIDYAPSPLIKSRDTATLIIHFSSSHHSLNLPPMPAVQKSKLASNDTVHSYHSCICHFSDVKIATRKVEHTKCSFVSIPSELSVILNFHHDVGKVCSYVNIWFTKISSWRIQFSLLLIWM